MGDAKGRGTDWRRLAIYFGLLVGIGLLVHLLYIGHIRPTADALIDAARAAGTSAPRSPYVVLRDGEQELCIILFLWSFVLTIWRLVELSAQWDYFDALATTASEALAQSAATANHPLIKAVTDSMALGQDGDIHKAREAAHMHLETFGRTLEASNSLFRYVIWAVPSIGFVGTVRGIGSALGEADKALAGDIASMTANLGVAFNSTLVALVLSLALMLFMHVLEGTQDKLIIDIEAECEERIRAAARKAKPAASEVAAA
ncbi:MAG: MotA/TolQ/ExbB proton channel family protein [Pseudomonadota bacterium]